MEMELNEYKRRPVIGRGEGGKLVEIVASNKWCLQAQ